MFQKAKVHLSRGKEIIVTAPGANAFPARYVESEGGSPYVVLTKSSKHYGVYYEYSNNCIPYAGYGLSSHTTVVAELEFNTENLSLLQGQQTESTKHYRYGPLPNGLACRLRNKEDEVHSGSKRNTKH